MIWLSCSCQQIFKEFRVHVKNQIVHGYKHKLGLFIISKSLFIIQLKKSPLPLYEPIVTFKLEFMKLPY